MKGKWIAYLGVASVLSITPAFQNMEKNPVEWVASSYELGIDDFASKAASFTEVVRMKDSVSLQSDFVELRNAFKRVEYLLAYADPEWHANFINGAPLPHLEPKTSGIVVLEPEGLQRMEELVYTDEMEWSVLLEKSKVLRDQTAQLKTFARHHNFDDRKIFEAVRLELIRTLAQGVTGFDTPGSDLAIAESAIALGAARDAILLYDDQLEKKDAAFASEFAEKWNGAVSFLEDNPDFDSFDRATFTVVYIEPLFQMTLTAQSILYIEFSDETSAGVESVNTRSKHIFSADLINPFFFTQMREGEYSPEKIALGKQLFFDPILSQNVQRSCASCHRPELAFTDGLPKSISLHFEGTVERNAPTLVNAALSPRFFYDLRTERLETQFDHVIFNPKEFNMTYSAIVERLSDSKEYRELFENAYGEGAQINKRNVETAIASFVVSLSAFDSPVDRWLRGEAEVSEGVKRGYNLFMGKAACGTCHFAPTFAGLVPPLFQDIETEVLGVPVDTMYSAMDPDMGRSEGIMKERSEIYNNSFKTLTVRNIKLTAPYMHNGVFTSLDQVMEFYNNGGGAGKGFEVPNQTLPFDSLSLNDAELADIIEFIEALTDLPDNGTAPESLPKMDGHPEWNARKVGGVY